ncbi:hypothetical protein [Halosegnis sp.]|uniref:hypothetical protein n=1 Tax=Halosegnis sp. TaxID=2864959 RepID=UPI0035D51C5B
MSPTPPEERIRRRSQQAPRVTRAGLALLSVPALYAAGLAVWLVSSLSLPLLVGAASLLAGALVADVLFVHPP